MFVKIFNDTVFVNLTEEICEGDSILFQGMYLSQEGMYADTLSATTDCDSILNLNLIVYANYEYFISDTICGGEVYEVGNNTYTETSTETINLLSTHGCDSIIHLNLFVENLIETQLQESICEGDSLLFGNQYLTESGQFTDTLIANNGCDSIIQINLIA